MEAYFQLIKVTSIFISKSNNEETKQHNGAAHYVVNFDMPAIEEPS